MPNVLNPEPESITLNTELETPPLEPATELDSYPRIDQSSRESTSNTETAEVATEELATLDADAQTEPVIEAAHVEQTTEVATTAETAPTEEPQTEIGGESPSLAAPVAEPVAEVTAIPVQAEPAAQAAEVPVQAEPVVQATEVPVQSVPETKPAVETAPVAVAQGQETHGHESMDDFSAALAALNANRPRKRQPWKLTATRLSPEL